MATVTKLGPMDHGRPMTWEGFRTGDYQDGFKYELIDGRLYVAPAADLPQDLVDDWLFVKVKLYSRKHPETINFVTNKARVFLPERAEITAPEPDLAAYKGFPLHRPFRELNWEDFSPILVGEILSPDDPGKDLIRNVALYLQVPTIKEYWILDPREDPERPTLHVYRRLGRRWRSVEVVAYGETYRTRLLPGFTLRIDPRS